MFTPKVLTCENFHVENLFAVICSFHFVAIVSFVHVYFGHMFYNIAFDILF